MLGCGSRLELCQRHCVANMQRSTFREGTALLSAGSMEPEPRLYNIPSGECTVPVPLSRFVCVFLFFDLSFSWNLYSFTKQGLSQSRVVFICWLI